MLSTMKQRTRRPSRTKPRIMESTASSSSCLKNFRKARGVPNIFRCAKTDHLEERVDQEQDALIDKAEEMVLFQAGLILDLRSPLEIPLEKAKKWTIAVDIHWLSETDLTDDSLEAQLEDDKRYVINMDVLGKKDFARYIEEKWFVSAQEQIQIAYCRAFNGKLLHRLRVDALNRRGIVGLNEAILEAGKDRLCQALKAITVHLEKDTTDIHRPVVINCAQGKDRTGMLVMLLQSLLGVPDREIIEDYVSSEAHTDFSADKDTLPGQLDRTMMKSAPRFAMVKTLRYLREVYGSVSPGYLRNIGFDDAWRVRLLTVLLLDMEEEPKKSRKGRSSRL